MLVHCAGLEWPAYYMRVIGHVACAVTAIQYARATSTVLASSQVIVDFVSAADQRRLSTGVLHKQSLEENGQ